MITEQELKLLTGMSFREFRVMVTQTEETIVGNKLTKFYLTKGEPVFLNMSSDEFRDWMQSDIALALEEA